MPEAPQERAAAPTAPAPVQPVVDADRPANADAPRERATWIDRPFVRAALIRQRIQRIRARRAAAGVTPIINRPLERRIIRQSRLQPGGGLTEAQRTRIRERIQAMPPEQRRQRIQEIRERRAATPPAARQRINEARRARIAERMRERGSATPPPAPLPINRPTLDQPAAPQPNIGAPTAPSAVERPMPDAPVNRGSMIVDDGGPGPEPMQMPEARPNLPAGDTPATASARRAAIQARIRAAREAQRARAAARAAARRNSPQRPPRPRIPRRQR